MVKQGDIVWVDFDPSLGHEQRGKRPGLVISKSKLTSVTNGLIQIVPITSKDSHGFPLHVKLDARTFIQGEIMCEQIKTMDSKIRNIKKIEACPQDLLERVFHLLNLMFQLDERKKPF